MIKMDQPLRTETLARRDLLSKEERQQKSCKLMEHLATIPAYNQAKTVLSFAHFRSEVITLPEVQRLLDAGKDVCLPLTVVQSKSLVVYKVVNLTTDLQTGYQGIPEPNPRHCAEVDPSCLDVVIVPGSVFDRRGGRMGYGGGYYDRFLARMAPEAVRIGVCFEVQMKTAIPLEPHDQLLDFIVTEDCVTECFRGRVAGNL